MWRITCHLLSSRGPNWRLNLRYSRDTRKNFALTRAAVAAVDSVLVSGWGRAGFLALVLGLVRVSRLLGLARETKRLAGRLPVRLRRDCGFCPESATSASVRDITRGPAGAEASGPRLRASGAGAPDREDFVLLLSMAATKKPMPRISPMTARATIHRPRPDRVGWAVPGTNRPARSVGSCRAVPGNGGGGGGARSAPAVPGSGGGQTARDAVSGLGTGAAPAGGGATRQAGGAAQDAASFGGMARTATGSDAPAGGEPSAGDVQAVGDTQATGDTRAAGDTQVAGSTTAKDAPAAGDTRAAEGSQGFLGKVRKRWDKAAPHERTGAVGASLRAAGTVLGARSLAGRTMGAAGTGLQIGAQQQERDLEAGQAGGARSAPPPGTNLSALSSDEVQGYQDAMHDVHRDLGTMAGAAGLNLRQVERDAMAPVWAAAQHDTLANVARQAGFGDRGDTASIVGDFATSRVEGQLMAQGFLSQRITRPGAPSTTPLSDSPALLDYDRGQQIAWAAGGGNLATYGGLHHAIRRYAGTPGAGQDAARGFYDAAMESGSVAGTIEAAVEYGRGAGVPDSRLDPWLQELRTA